MQKVGVSSVDLFCGAGGLTHGLLQEGINVEAGLDIDEACKFAYEANNKSIFISKDISKITGKEVNSYFKKGQIKLLAGCAPCQPFSKYTQGKNAEEHQKWSALRQFSRLINEVSPEIVTMENVPQLTKHEVYKDFVSNLKRAGYLITSKIIFCPDYGIPQNRQRLVLLASRLGEISILSPTHSKKEYKTVKETIGHLPKLELGDQCKVNPLHKTSTMSDLNLKRIRASKPDGSWEDWDRSLIAKCHAKPGRSTYRSVYGRMSWGRPSPTITTQFNGFGNGRFGHPEQNRALSLLEGSLLQTFPENYQFFTKKTPAGIKQITKMIGNAVPVELGKVIGKSINFHLKKVDE